MSDKLKKRVQKWDNLKCFLIVTVVYGHFAAAFADISYATGVITFFIYTFHMPLFIFVSGLFSKRNIKEKRWTNISSYLFLYVFIKILMFAADWIDKGYQPSFRLFSAASTPWYVFCLFGFSVITILVEKIHPKAVLIISLILALLVGYDSSLRDFFCISRIFVFFPFFYLGYILDQNKVTEFFEKKKIKVLSVFILIVIFVIIAIFYDEIKDVKLIFTGRNPYSVLFKKYPFGFLVRALCYIISTLVGGSIIALTPKQLKTNIFSSIGSKSLQIYVFHQPLKVIFVHISESFNLERFFCSYIPLYALILSIIAFAICLLPGIHKPLDYIMSLPHKIKKQ